MPVLEWVNTSTLSELLSAVNKLSRLFNIICNSFAMSDNNIDSAKFWRFTDKAKGGREGGRVGGREGGGGRKREGRGREGREVGRERVREEGRGD